MGKDLHYSIRPFIENALRNHPKITKIESLTVDNFFAYKLSRIDMSSVVLILSDDYTFTYSSLLSLPPIVKDGAFVLIAKPEANGDLKSDKDARLGIGKLKKLLRALYRQDFWNYELPE